MKHLTLVILLALAPLSWGEDEFVLYCVGETRALYNGEVLKTSDLEDWKRTFRITEENVESSYDGQTTNHTILNKTDAIILATYADDFVVNTYQFWQDDKNKSAYQMYFSAVFPSAAAIIHANCSKF